MKKKNHFLVFCLWAILASCGTPIQQPQFPQESIAQPRIGVAGIMVENSTFLPHRAIMVARENFMPDYLHPDSILGQGAVWLPALMGGAQGRGLITRESYEEFVSNALEIIKANMPYDAFWFYIHGACSVEGLDDVEGDFLQRIRGVIGHDALVTTTMDLHGNVSWRLAMYTDLITTFRTAPHDDARESHRRGVVNLLERLHTGKGRPAYKAWVAVPILLSGEWTSTRVEPAKSLYAMVPEVEAMPGVIDAGIWIGYVWADERRSQGVVMVYGDDKRQVEVGARKLAQKFWDVRHEFDFEAPAFPLEEALEIAIASDKKPFFISDMGDNPGGGGSGEVTWTLARVLRHPEFQKPDGKSLLYQSIHAPGMIDIARRAGIGGHAEGYAGAILDYSYEPPIWLSGTVVWVTPEPDQTTGGRANPVAVIKIGNVYVVIANNGTPSPNLTGSGIDPREMDIVMVKQGYLVPHWFNMQADWVMAKTRGGVDQDFASLPYKRVIRPIFPLDPDMSDPELNVIFVPSARHLYGR